MRDMFFSQAKTKISNNDFSSSQAKRVKVVTRLKDFSGRRRPVSLHMLTVVVCAISVVYLHCHPQGVVPVLENPG